MNFTNELSLRGVRKVTTFKRFIACAGIILLLFPVLVIAQDATDEPDEASVTCTADGIENINFHIEENAVALDVFLDDPPDDVYQMVDEITVIQRRFWTAMLLQDDCLELFTRGYRFGRLLDEYAIAFGVGAAAVEADLKDDDDAADRLVDQLEKHLREAQRVLRLYFPEYMDMLGDDRFQ